MTRKLAPVWECDHPECGALLIETGKAQLNTHAPSMQGPPPGWRRTPSPYLRDYCPDHAYVAEEWLKRKALWDEARRAHYKALTRAERNTNPFPGPFPALLFWLNLDMALWWNGPCSGWVERNGERLWACFVNEREGERVFHLRRVPADYAPAEGESHDPEQYEIVAIVAEGVFL